MATFTSQNFTTSNPLIIYRIVVTESSQSIAANSTTINVKVQGSALRPASHAYAGRGTCFATINGESLSQAITNVEAIYPERWTTLLETNKTIAHNADGTKTIGISSYINHAEFYSNSQGFNVTLTTIKRPAIITVAPDFKDTDNPTITYVNYSGAGVSSVRACISVDGASPTVAYRSLSLTGSTYTFTLTQAERTALLNSTPNSNSVNVTYIIQTVIGGFTYQNSYVRKMTVTNGAPVFSGLSYYDSNPVTVNITGNSSLIVQSNSNIAVKFNSVSAVKGAKLASIKINFFGAVYNKTLSGSTQNNVVVSIGTVTVSSAQTAYITIFDTRGNFTQVNLNIAVLAWTLPTANISLNRKSNYYDETYLKVGAVYSPLNNTNTLQIKYQYKPKNSESWSELFTIQNNVTETLSFDNQLSYDFKIILTDRIGSTTYNKTLPVGIPLMYIDKVNQAVSINCLPNKTHSFELWNRLNLQNDLRENIAELSSYKIVDPITPTQIINTAQFKIFDENGVDQVSLQGGLIGGGLFLKNRAGRLVAEMQESNAGGVITLRSRQAQNSIRLFTNLDNSGRINIYDSLESSNISLNGSTGVVTCVSVNQTSSRKAKDNIKPLELEEALKILDIEAVTFDFKNKAQGINHRGFIAEDVKEVIPELVTDETDDTYAALNYVEMIPYLQKVISAQADKISELEARLSALEAKFDEKQ